MAKTRSDFVWFSKLAEQAERYEEMVDSIKRIATSGQELTVEERQILSVAYKNAIDARRASLRIVNSVLRKEKAKGGREHQMQLVKGYRVEIEAELCKICDDILNVLDKILIPKTASNESKAFYYKMRGLHHRYLAEYGPVDQRKAFADQALETYKFASDFALTELPPTHPIRLGVALNFSTFYYDVLKDIPRACHLSKQAFDDAIAELDTLSEESYNDSTLIMQLLRDNLQLWSSESADNRDDSDDD